MIALLEQSQKPPYQLNDEYKCLCLSWIPCMAVHTRPFSSTAPILCLIRSRAMESEMANKSGKSGKQQNTPGQHNGHPKQLCGTALQISVSKPLKILGAGWWGKFPRKLARLFREKMLVFELWEITQSRAKSRT